MSLRYASREREIMIYCGSIILIAGVIGDILSTLVFVSLRTFRQSSCAFYLTIISIVNTGQLFTGLLSRILTASFLSDGTETSLFYCKFRFYCFQVCVGISLTCLCFAIIDQYCATCTRARWRQFSNIKYARNLVAISCIFWVLHGIPFLVYYDHIISDDRNRTICVLTNRTYGQYRANFILIILVGYLPVTIAAIFSCLAYRNVRQMSHRTVPLIRRELDKQLTVMVLVQVIIGVFTILPYTTLNGIMSSISTSNTFDLRAQTQYPAIVTVLIYYVYFASGFYIYMCASERYRRQFFYVLFQMHLKRWKRLNNQILPEN